MDTQISLDFEASQLLQGTYPLKYHLLRVGVKELAGRFWHVNSIWDGYNSNGYPSVETEGRLSNYSFANSKEDIEKIISRAANETVPNKTHYIMARMNWQVYHSMPEYIK